MTQQTETADLVRQCFRFFMAKDIQALGRLLSPDFTFTSPLDDHIDKAQYFERCVPNADLFASHTVEQLFVEGNAAFVSYEAVLKDGSRFHNVEFFVTDGAQIESVNVYFGAKDVG